MGRYNIGLVRWTTEADVVRNELSLLIDTGRELRRNPRTVVGQITNIERRRLGLFNDVSSLAQELRHAVRMVRRTNDIVRRRWSVLVEVGIIRWRMIDVIAP